MKKIILTIIGGLAIILALVFIFIFARNFYLIKTGQLIEWQGKWYTMDEIRKIYPPQVYEVEAKNTPEEVYAQFREALLSDDLETALSLITEESREKYQEAFEDEEKLDKYKVIPSVENIKKSESDSLGNFNNYYYFLEDVKYDIEFIKNSDGYWQIDII